MKQKIIHIVGRSNSGKTTLVERLISHYKASGVKVAVLKSMRHDFDTNSKGKDTSRYRDAGAQASVITNGKKFALVMDIDDSVTPMDLVVKYYGDYDIVIIEGYKEGRGDKIEVIGNSLEDNLFRSGIAGIKMVVSDESVDTSLPLFKRDDISGIVKEIEKLFF